MYVTHTVDKICCKSLFQNNITFKLELKDDNFNDVVCVMFPVVLHM